MSLGGFWLRKLLEFLIKGRKIKELNRFSYLSLSDALEFYFVFEGLRFDGRYTDIKEAIDKEILSRADELNGEFSKLSNSAISMLLRLAKGGRKLNHMHEPRFKAAFSEIAPFISVEKTREMPLVAPFGGKLKKEFRRYQITDKIHFSKNFYRFWFKFCHKEMCRILDDKNAVLDEIMQNLSAYFSLPFELICADFLSAKMGIKRELISSYWDKNNEIDIYADDGKIIIAGEVKYKDHRVCASLLRELKQKCENIGIQPDFYVIFSKNGFSAELERLKAPNILLFEPNDFKDIL